jgi:hypothetical protein
MQIVEDKLKRKYITSMKKVQFMNKACKAIAANKIQGATKMLILEIVVNGYCRPVWQLSRSYHDSTQSVKSALESLGIFEQGTSIEGLDVRKGYLVKNDAPRGGKLGTLIEVNFEY